MSSILQVAFPWTQGLLVSPVVRESPLRIWASSLDTLQYMRACLLYKYLGFLILQTSLQRSLQCYRLICLCPVQAASVQNYGSCSSDKHHRFATFPIACTSPAWKTATSLLMEPVEVPPHTGTDELPLFLHCYCFKEEKDKKSLKIKRLKQSLAF